VARNCGPFWLIPPTPFRSLRLPPQPSPWGRLRFPDLVPVPEYWKTTGVIGTYPPQRVSEPPAEGQIACASGPTHRRPDKASFGRSRPGSGLHGQEQ
jgi:hypothetical protein